MTATKFELTFWGSATVRAYAIPRYRRYHKTLESARAEAAKVHAAMEAKGLPSAAHPAVIYGADGKQY
jgi:hypothetical protein